MTWEPSFGTIRNGMQTIFVLTIKSGLPLVRASHVCLDHTFYSRKKFASSQSFNFLSFPKPRKYLRLQNWCQ